APSAPQRPAFVQPSLCGGFAPHKLLIRLLLVVMVFSPFVETAAPLQPMRTGYGVAKGRRGSPLPSLRGHNSQRRLRARRATPSAEFGGFSDFRDGVKVASLRLQKGAATKGEKTWRQRPAPLPCVAASRQRKGAQPEDRGGDKARLTAQVIRVCALIAAQARIFGLGDWGRKKD